MANVGVIGLGHMGRLHMMNCLHIDDVNVVAAADPSKKALKRAMSVGVKNLYTDYHDLLQDPQIDTVIISLPNFLHFDSAQSALERGLHVFIEKPLARTSNECREIVKWVQKSGKKFMIGHSLRFVEAVEQIRKAAEKGYLGSIEALTLEDVINGPFSHPAVPAPVSDWWFDPEKAGGGVLLDLGYHMIDLSRFFVGDSTVLFSCLDHKFNLPVEDSAIIVLQSSHSSAKSIVNVGWYQKTVFPKFNFRLIIHGNAGYMSTDELIPRNLYYHAAKEGIKNLVRKVVGRKIHPLSYTYFYESYFKELKHFFDCIKQDSEPSVSAIDGLKTLEIIEEAYKISATKPSDQD